MKKKMALLCLMGMTLSANVTAAQARCIEEEWVRLRERIASVGECGEGEPLARAIMTRSYPKMTTGPYRVEYWRGSFVRTVAIETTYLHLLLNRCGMRNDVLLKEEIVERTESTVDFAVENPNLSDDIVASYELVPMTEAEARVALEEARGACESYQP